MIWHAIDPKTGLERASALPGICDFGITEAIAIGIGGALTSAGVGAATAATIGSVAAPAVLGAGMGALSSAVTGGKVGKGALMGGLGGLTYGALGAAFPETMGSLGMGPAMATKGADGNWIPGPGGFGGGAGGEIPYDVTDDFGNPVESIPGMGGAGSKSGGFLSSIGSLLNSGGGSGGSSNGNGFNLGRGLFGLVGGALSQASRPQQQPIDRGPYFDKPLVTSGYLNRQAVDPYTPIGNDWYTYGEHPYQRPFFTNNQLRLAHGGALSARRQSMARPAPFDTSLGQRYVPPDAGGDGQSDSVDAKLSAGEYVMDAATVSRLGNGSNEAGAKKLDEMRRRIAQHTSGSRRVIPKKAREPMSYLAAAGGRR